MVHKSPDPVRLLISVKEARKVLGSLAKEMTNEELESLIIDSDQMVRILLRAYLVRKSDMVK